MGANFNRVKTWIPEVLTASDLNAEFDNILNNFDTDGLDDASTNETAMGAVADPYPGAATSLATSLRGEIQRLRYVIKQILGTSKWYIYHDLVSKTEAYTATTDDRVIKCDATGGAFTVTLPTAVGITDKEFVIVKSDSSALAVTVDGNASETLNGLTTLTLDRQYNYCHIISDGANWVVLSGDYVSMTKWRKGADTASATTLTFGDDGNYFDITGSTGPITDFPDKGTGAVVKLHFDGTPTLEHNAAKLVLPDGIDITVTSGDEFEFTQAEAGVWRLTSSSRVVTGNIADGSVTTDKIANRSITHEKMKIKYQYYDIPMLNGNSRMGNIVETGSGGGQSGGGLAQDESDASAVISNATDTTGRWTNLAVDDAGHNCFFGATGEAETRSDQNDILRARVRPSDVVANIYYWFGAVSNITTLTSDSTPDVEGAFFRYDTSEDGTAFWRCVTVEGTWATGNEVTTTGVAVASGTEALLEIRFTATSITFYIDNTPVATHNTVADLPTSTTSLDVTLGVTSRSNTGVSRGIDVGEIYLINEGM